MSKIQVRQNFLDLFPVPVSIGSLGEGSREFNKALLDEIKTIFKAEKTEQRTGIGVFQTAGGLEEKYEMFKVLQGVISSSAVEILNKTGTTSSEIIAENFWVNVNNSSSGYNMPHGHMFSHMWTGVYFPTSGFSDTEIFSDKENLDEPAELSSSSVPPPGSLVLLDPHEATKSGIALRNTSRYPYWGNPVCVAPKEGTMVLFPTYLPHMVTPTGKDNFTRISIAFMIKAL